MVKFKAGESIQWFDVERDCWLGGKFMSIDPSSAELFIIKHNDGYSGVCSLHVRPCEIAVDSATQSFINGFMSTSNGDYSKLGDAIDAYKNLIAMLK